MLASPSDSAAGIGVLLIVPAAHGAAAGAVQVESAGSPGGAGPVAHLIVGARAALLDAVLDEQVARRAHRVRPVARSRSLDWLSSKSISVVPLGS